MRAADDRRLRGLAVRRARHRLWPRLRAVSAGARVARSYARARQHAEDAPRRQGQGRMTSFEALVEPHRAALRLHCYRMLGSSHDSDDMVQETMVRALRARHTLEDPARAGAWLYRIATNVCLDELARRPKRARGPELGPPADPGAPLAAALGDEVWI